MSSPPAPGFGRAFLLALLLHLAAYLPSLPNGFVFDDHAIVEEQAEVAGGAPLGGVWSTTWFHRDREGGAIAYRPVALTSLGLDVRLFGLDPAALRAGNILWGALGAALLGLLAVELGAGRAAAVVVVSVFSLHPVRSEVVLSIVGRAELLSFAAVAGALLLALRSERGTRTVRRAVGAASGAVLAFGLLSKETAFAAPFLLAVAVLARGGDGGWRARLSSLVPAGLAFAVALVSVLALRVAVLGGPLTGPEARVSPVENKLAARSPVERLTGALSLVPLAAARLVWPRTLVADYGSNAIPDAGLRSAGRASAGVALLLAGVAGALHLGRRSVLGTVGLAWTLLSWVPFANFVFPTAVLFSERLLFLPAAGVALVLGGVVTAAPVPVRRTASLCVFALLLVGAARVWSRTSDWREDGTLFQATVRDAPGNGRAWINLGVLSLARGDAESARTELGAGLRADSAMRPHVEGMARHAAALGKEELQRAVEGALSSSP